MSSIGPGVTGRKGSWSVAADGPEKLPVEDDAVTAWLKSLGPMRPFAVTIPDAQQILGRPRNSGRGNAVLVPAAGRAPITIAIRMRAMTPRAVRPVLSTFQQYL